MDCAATGGKPKRQGARLADFVAAQSGLRLPCAGNGMLQ
jgi:hypothetical protein